MCLLLSTANDSAPGTAVFAGMLGVTAFGLFLTPVFFVVFQRLTGWWAGQKKTENGHGGTQKTRIKTKTDWPQ